MKIGVTGSDHICDRIQKTLEKRMPDLEVVYRRSNDYRYGLEAAAQFQKGKVSGIIFTGPTNYHYALKRLEPNVPWTFLPHNQASILKALAESAVRYSCVPDVISIDMYEEQLVQGTLEEIGHFQWPRPCGTRLFSQSGRFSGCPHGFSPLQLFSQRGKNLLYQHGKNV